MFVCRHISKCVAESVRHLFRAYPDDLNGRKYVLRYLPVLSTAEDLLLFVRAKYPNAMWTRALLKRLFFKTGGVFNFMEEMLQCSLKLGLGQWSFLSPEAQSIYNTIALMTYRGMLEEEEETIEKVSLLFAVVWPI